MKEAEARGLENVNRIDILFDRLVDFPRRSVQLLEGYLKNLDVNKEILKLTLIQSSNHKISMSTRRKENCEFKFLAWTIRFTFAGNMKQGSLEFFGPFTRQHTTFV